MKCLWLTMNILEMFFFSLALSVCVITTTRAATAITRTVLVWPAGKIMLRFQLFNWLSKPQTTSTVYSKYLPFELFFFLVEAWRQRFEYAFVLWYHRTKRNANFLLTCACLFVSALVHRPAYPTLQNIWYIKWTLATYFNRFDFLVKFYIRIILRIQPNVCWS